MNQFLQDAIEDNPIIVAIKDDDCLQKCKTSDSRIVFILYGDILNIADIVEQVKAAGKMAFVHIDLIQGLHSNEIAVDYIKQHTKADGIISTKAPLICRARELKLYTVMRFFMIDSMAFSNMEHQIKKAKPDVIEVLPALMPKMIRKICKVTNHPVIAGGLVSDKEDVMACLDAGASCISSTNDQVWFL
jgi:glycerol-3-phosphate responsive antiterminator